jgi:hypothetical protein
MYAVAFRVFDTVYFGPFKTFQTAEAFAHMLERRAAAATDAVFNINILALEHPNGVSSLLRDIGG